MAKKIKELFSSDTAKFFLVLSILMGIAYYRSYGRYELKVKRMNAQGLKSR